MNLPISENEIKEMVHLHQIDSNFTYLDNALVMYLVIKEDMTLTHLINYHIGLKICLLLSRDKELSLPSKKALFYHLIDYCDNLSSELISLIDSEDYYYQLASKSFYVYTKLYETDHPYKKIEEQLFWDKYQHQYIFSPDYVISYAKKSSVVLLRTLKANMLNIYYISFFDNEAFSDEVINYLENNINLDIINIPQMYRVPKVKLLKLKNDLNFIFSLTENEITDEILDYLHSIDFKTSLIDEYISRTNNYPVCLYNSHFILILLQKDVDNIKYFKGNNVSRELLEYLNSHNYIYRETDNSILLKDKEIFNRFISNQPITVILHQNIKLDNQQIELIGEKIINDNIDFSDITNEYLLNNTNFLKRIIDYYHIPNPYQLKEKHLISSLARSLDKLSLVFSNNDIKIIIREIIKNDYHINMIGILENIDVFKLKMIHDKLYQKESKFNNNFNFYHFIKVMEYFANHLNLVHELDEEVIDNVIINNLAVVINNNDYVNYDELKNYQKVFVKRVSGLNEKEKLYKLLVNSDEDSLKVALIDIFNIPQLLYLQLEFPKDSLSYQLLESYIDMINLLKQIRSNQIDLSKLFEKMLLNNFPNPLFDLSVMKENILRLYAIMYHKLGLSRDKLRQKGKSEFINGKEVFDITGEKYVIYLHTENFNNQDDSTAEVVFKTNNSDENYICTSYASELCYKDMDRAGMQVYELKNPTSLIAFGSRDVFIHHTKRPLFGAESRYVNPIDMAFLNKVGYTNTEFDFLRIDDSNNKLDYSFVIAKNRTDAIKKTLRYDNVIIFDEDKHYNWLKEVFQALCENVENLNYKDLYYLIGLSTKFSLSSDVVESIVKRVSELSEKEQIILQNALENYHISVKLIGKVK